MPRPSQRSRSKRRVYVRIPSGKTVIRYEKRHKKFYRCAICGKPLAGVPREPSKVPKNQRRPERAYGGYICAECLRRELTIEIIDSFSKGL